MSHAARALDALRRLARHNADRANHAPTKRERADSARIAEDCTQQARIVASHIIGRGC